MSDDDRPVGPPPDGNPPRRPARPRRPRQEQEPSDYNDIDWDDEEYESLFQDEKLRGAIGISDYMPLQRAIRIGVTVAAVVIAIVLVVWTRNQFDPPGSPGEEVTLEVPAGSNVTSFAKTLDEQGIVPSALAFRLWSRTHGSPEIQAGEYAFHRNSSAGAALEVLKLGPKEETDRLTIPEGFRLAQIAERVGRIPGFSKEEFLEIAESGNVRSDFQPTNVKSLEGFLFPDTYLLSPRDTERTLLERMRNQFDNNARQLGLDRSSRAIGKSPYQTLIIASMIEAEAKVPQDRGRISQVIQNRLQRNMTLGIDATILYGLGNSKSTLSQSDLDRPGPYNTRLNTGLPPTPIGNPGKASLQAALAPTPGPWLYYVLSDADGSHAFATTLEEHNRNVAAARQKGLL